MAYTWPDKSQKYIEDNNLDQKLMNSIGSILNDKLLFAKTDLELSKDIYDLIQQYNHD